MVALWAAAFSLAVVALPAQSASPDPTKLLQEADRLAWLRAWTAAEPLYAQAQKVLAERGDRSGALYAEVSALRGELPRLPVPVVSAQLALYLENEVVQSDDRLRLRCLVIKGETDEDLDPSLAAQSWRDAQALAVKIGDEAWANRAKGELGLVAFLQGDVGASVIGLGQALKVAQSNGDVSSVVRWMTLFGHGYVQLGRPEEALDFYDRALKVASAVPELQFPVMTYVGRSNALIKLQRFAEAEQILSQAMGVAAKFEASGYQAQLLMQRALIADERGQPDTALALLAEATAKARAAGGSRIVAEIALDAARIQRKQGQTGSVERTLRDGIDIARAMEEHLLLPRLLAQLADLRSSQKRYADSAALLDEARDLLEGLFTSVSSPWLQSRLVAGMDDVFLARIRLEGARGQDVSAMYSAIEEARARSLLELLVNRPLSAEREPRELREGERQIATLQRQLLQTTDRAARERLLDQIFAAEERLAPVSTVLFNRTRRVGPRQSRSLHDLQHALRSDEVVIEFALTDPQSFAIVATKTSARVQTLVGRSQIRSQVESLLKRVSAGEDVSSESRRLAALLLGTLPDLQTHRRLIISPDAELHRVPFELLLTADGRSLLDSHVVSYVPSGSVLALLRSSERPTSVRRALAISASPAMKTAVVPTAKAVTRDVYDLDARQLRPLPSADDEARSVGSILGPVGTTVLIGESATEAELKHQPLDEFQVLHFAVHGIPSSKFPSRAALLMNAGGAEDGVLQAREILTLRLGAVLVTLSACDTGNGSLHGQDGAASLVRPFVAAGARSVVANLWAADDTFSLALMREFYRGLAGGQDVGEALRGAKLHMLKLFGPQALPRLWSGVLAYGDSRGVIAKTTEAIPSRQE